MVDKTYMDNIAAKVERRVKRLSDEMPSRNMTEVALFVAMDYCDQYMKSVGDGSNLRVQIKDYLQESSYARKELEEVQKENENLKAEIEKLKSMLSSQSSGVASEKKVLPAPEENNQPVTKTPVIETRPKKNLNPETEVSSAVQGLFSDEAFAESADATAEIMSFFEQKAFDDEE